MKVKIFLLLALIVFSSGCLSQTSKDYSILYKEDFSEDINIKNNIDSDQKYQGTYKDWSISIPPAVLQDNYSLEITDNQDHIDVLEVIRKNSEEEGGIISLVNKRGISMNGYRYLRLNADVKLIEHTLKGSGWWTDVHNKEGEYPIHVYLNYEDVEGNKNTWSWGFLSTPNPDQKINYELIEKNTWAHFESGNLMLLDPKPAKIVSIRLSFEGWDYHVMIDNVEIVAK